MALPFVKFFLSSSLCWIRTINLYLPQVQNHKETLFVDFFCENCQSNLSTVELTLNDMASDTMSLQKLRHSFSHLKNFLNVLIIDVWHLPCQEWDGDKIDAYDKATTFPLPSKISIEGWFVVGSPSSPIYNWWTDCTQSLEMEMAITYILLRSWYFVETTLLWLANFLLTNYTLWLPCVDALWFLKMCLVLHKYT